MRRYTNWGVVVVGAILMSITLASQLWIPEVQPYLVEEVVEESFSCRVYLSAEECDVLEEMNEEEPDKAFALLEAMDPENDFMVDDDDVQELATQMRDLIGSSDTPVVSDIKRGVFNAPLDAIHNATGQAKLLAIVPLESQEDELTQYWVRLEGRGDEPFQVTNAPNLRIYLSQHADPTTTQELFSGEGGALDVGRLKGNSGAQNYRIDREFDPTRYRSLVIYSPDLEQIFGVAPFIDQ